MDKINKILTERWSIMRADFNAILLTVLPALKAGNIEAVQKMLDNNHVTAYAMAPVQGMPNVCGKYELDDMNLPADSVAVISLEGMLYSWETFRLEERLQQCYDNPRICGVVLWINGPGGMVTHVDLAARMIEESPKPIATFVANTMASAHLWLGTAAQRIFLASPMCSVGSCGVMLTYYDEQPYFKQLGVDVRDIYPDSADLKNQEYRAVRERNDEGPLKQNLTKLHEIFARDLARHIGVAYDAEKEVFRGKLYTGDEAIREQLADQYGTLSDAVMWCYTQAVVARTRQ